MFYILMNMKRLYGHFGGIEINYLSKCDKEIFHDKQRSVKV